MKKYIYPLAFAATALITLACSDDVVNDIPQTPDSQKEMISFSLSDGAANTRAGFTGADTRIVMRIQSNERAGSGVKYNRTIAKAEQDATDNATSYSNVKFKWETYDYTRYWDDAHGRKSLLSIYAIAIPNKNSETILPTNTLSAGDATTESAWGSVATNTLTWAVDQTQTTANIDDKDLVFSNNIKAGGTNGVYRWDYNTGNYKYSNNGGTDHDAGQMLFYQNGVATNVAPTDAAGHFDRGHMVFNHALSRLTVTLEKGSGFESSPFKFADGTNIKVLGMYYSGTFDVSTGEWAKNADNTPAATSGDIATIAPLSTYTDAVGSYRVQVLPGYTFSKTGTANVLEFTIDNNTYYITQKMLFEALTHDDTDDSKDGALKDQASSDGITMEMGKNYTFTIKVNKKEVESITATLIKWSDVKAADTSIKNGHINITTSVIGATDGDACSDLYLYRYGQDLGSIITTDTYTADQYQADYLTTGNKGVQPTETSTGSKVWQTGWYFENNRTAYHIRSINSTAYGASGANVKNPTSGSAYTYFELANGAQATHDYHWGAPMSSTNFTYSETEGYKNHLHKGITAINENQTINLSELHMMSNINIILKTTTDDGKVALRTGSGTATDPYKYATVTITRLYNAGTVDMGIGLVSTTGDVDASEEITNPKDNSAYSNKYFKQDASNADIVNETNPFSWAVVPQYLKRGTATDTTEDFYVGITITTPDNNQYYVVKKLSEIKAESIGSSKNQTVNDYITRWYPNHSYTYTFTITKTRIESMTCSVAKWSDVVAADLGITLEN